MDILAVGIGGAIGAALRFLCTLVIPANTNLPLATWLVNSIGAFLLSFLLTAKCSWPPPIKLALTTGLLGSFTTFSTFSAETLQLWQNGHIKAAILYSSSSVIVGLVCSALGYWLAVRRNRSCSSS